MQIKRKNPPRQGQIPSSNTMSLSNENRTNNIPAYAEVFKHGFFRLPNAVFMNALMRRPAYLSVWCWLLAHAAYCDGKRSAMYKGEMIWLKEGQVTTGAYQIAKDTGVRRGTVENILKAFKKAELIEVQSSPNCSLISLKNSHLYQKIEELNEELRRNDAGTSKDFIKKEKNEQKDNKSSRFQKMTDVELEQEYKAAVLKNGWQDESYAEKTWSQAMRLSKDNRIEFRRKVCVMLHMAATAALQKRARTLCNEIAGYVNDKGDMERKLSQQELAERERFADGLTD